LEVLSKLPNKVLDSNGNDSPSKRQPCLICKFQTVFNFTDMLSSPTKVRKQDSLIDTGTISDQLGWGASSSVDKKGMPIF